MSVRFDEGLVRLVAAIGESLGADVFTKSVVVRDATGRLSLIYGGSLAPTKKKLAAKALLAQLEQYARPDRPLATEGDVGVEALLLERPNMQVVVSGIQIALLDRRIVGADWLREWRPLTSAPSRFAFTSLKGGVGRSTALSVTASDLAMQGKRVLVVDLDMEAPGVGTMLLTPDTQPKYGMLDALVEQGVGGLDNDLLSQLTGPSRIAEGAGAVDVVPAFGALANAHPTNTLAKLARAYIEMSDGDGNSLSYRDRVSMIVDELLARSRYDAVLFDSRAGLHETAATAFLGLGADVFLFGLDEPQTYEGFRALFGHLSATGGGRREWMERVTLVQGRARSKEELRSFEENCFRLLRDVGVGDVRQRTAVPLPAEPFGDVPWDDTIDDHTALADVDESTREPVAIIEDDKFRSFSAISGRNLIIERLYRSSFGDFLGRVESALGLGT